MRSPPTHSPDDLDVLSFGEALVDFFPERPGLPLAEVDVFHRHLGGAPCNLSVGLARQGARVGLMTLVGPDEFGRFVRNRLVEEGVDVTALGTHPSAKTGITFVAVGAAGERSFLFFRHPSADQSIRPEDIAASAILRARVFHLGSSTMSSEPSRSATLAALEIAVSAGRIISFDPNLRAHRWELLEEARPLIRSVLARTAIAKISDDELTFIVDTADPCEGARRIRDLGAGMVIVTLGAKGCYFDAPAGQGTLPGESVTTVDTTGAGDGFLAGVLATLAPRFARGTSITDLTEADLREACSAGNHLGACAVTRMGATAGIPRR